ncbi:MAG TPA: DsbE family thiol:disulfide interchange protein [Rhodopila sp.]|uniref:DsbE family thiol:disulfide interchange protein n=1 Tax=Rhodopila sp. TaxID=2480087 RepID=UPI002CAA35B0|nr:DsbE family thiol:disulfide interchange protein [Rhodopila sp.]HVY14360.1 DsbE family thiol:disulfide interchange protein [Rhodopila sp.]
MRRLIFLLPLLLFLVVAGYFAETLDSGRDVHELPSAMIAKPAPNFDIPSLNGPQAFTLAALKGRPIVVNFFASWCVPCRIEHPVLMRLKDENHIPIYGIAYKDARSATTQLLKTYGDPYQSIGVDRNGDVGLNFGVYGVPETYVIDSAGIIRKRFVGPLTAESVDKELLPLLRRLDSANAGPAGNRPS